MNYNRKLILENKEEYYGFGFGDSKQAVFEIVFNTSMVGYQEILSDPSYTDQAVVMTYPLIGNYGMAEEDYESEKPTIGADESTDHRCIHIVGRRVEDSLRNDSAKRCGQPGQP